MISVDLDTIRRAGVAKYGELGVTDAELQTWLDGRKAQPAPRVWEDVYLACGLVQRKPQALEAFDRTLRPALERAVRSMGNQPWGVDEIVQQTCEKLLVADDDGQPARVRSYGAVGSLLSYATTAASRLIAQGLRSHKAEDSLESQQLSALPSTTDVERLVMKKEQGSRFEEAFFQALRSLSPRDRSLLRLNLVEGVAAEKLAPMHDVSRATITRWVAEAREELAVRTRKALVDARVASDDAEPFLTSLQSQFDVSLARLFREADDGLPPKGS